MNNQITMTITLAAAVGLLVLGHGPPATAKPPQNRKTTPWYVVRAGLEFTNDAGTREIEGKAVYRERLHRGTVEKRIRVFVTGAAPLRLYGVQFGGERVGFFMTDLFGDGSLFLRSDRDAGRWELLSPDFPTVVPGEVARVGRATGEFGFTRGSQWEP